MRSSRRRRARPSAYSLERPSIRPDTPAATLPLGVKMNPFSIMAVCELNRLVALGLIDSRGVNPSLVNSSMSCLPGAVFSISTTLALKMVARSRTACLNGKCGAFSPKRANP